MKKFHIVYFNYLYDLYEGALGSTIKAQRLLSALERYGFRVSFYWLNAKPGSLREQKGTERSPSSPKEFLKKHLASILHEPNQIAKNLPGFFREWAIVKRERPDLLIVRLQAHRFSAALLARMLKIPFLLEADAPSAYEKRTFFPQYRLFPGLVEFLEKINFRLADKIFVVSRVLQRYVVEKGIPADKVVVIPNGVSFDENRASERGKIRAVYGLDSQVVVGFVGSFHYWHGVEGLFQVMRRILQTHSGVSFLLVGAGGPMADQLKEMVYRDNLQNRVVLTGFVPPEEVPSYIAAMDIALAPYPDLEFFYYSPVKVFEYMAYGKAVVGSRIGQIAELVKDGVTGLLCRPGDMEDLTEKLNYLIEHPHVRKTLGQRARQQALREFTWEKRAEELAKLCRKVIEQ